MKTVIKSINSGNYLIVDVSESGQVGYFWTDSCEKATSFESDHEAKNTIDMFGFRHTQVVKCRANYGANGG